MMELDQFSAHHLVIHGEKFLTTIYRLSRLEEKVLTGDLDDDEISLSKTVNPLEVDVTLPEREYGMEGICGSLSAELLEKLSTLENNFGLSSHVLCTCAFLIWIFNIDKSKNYRVNALIFYYQYVLLVGGLTGIFCFKCQDHVIRFSTPIFDRKIDLKWF